MRPFTISVPDDTLDAIRARVAAFPWFPAPADEPSGDEALGWARGVNTGALKELCAHWLERYDWRAAEAALNRWPQYVATVDGLDIHFVHVVGEAGGKRPLLLTHGWPGSHFEFWDAIEPLAFPSRFGGDPADAFDLVIPSLPGYGFSGKPAKPFGQRATARLWNGLMTQQLGYGRYMAQGGDWGGLVTSWLGFDHAPACAAIHLNMIGLRPTPASPRTDEERAWLADTAKRMQAGGAYFMQQATKPQTLAMALMDSPVGAAAWILEKFHGWADLSGKGLWGAFSKDQLLTNIMIYLVTGSMATGVWYYRALFEENGGVGLPEGARVEIPTGFANFPGESLYKAPPRSWAERAYNVVHWADMPRGGHFAAIEEPALFVEEVRSFARTHYRAD
jgi:pimeloyl-ACP methyl ester carboxylesterase